MKNHSNGDATRIPLDVGTARPSSLKSPGLEPERRLSPHPWARQSNVSQSSLKSSDFSRQSHISSNRSSDEGHPQSGTSIDRPVSTTFAAIQQSHLGDNTIDDKLPTEVIMPAALEERGRATSHSSNHSAASSGKRGSKIGGWFRKKRGFSVSSSGGGSSVVSD